MEVHSIESTNNVESNADTTKETKTVNSQSVNGTTDITESEKVKSDVASTDIDQQNLSDLKLPQTELSVTTTNGKTESITDLKSGSELVASNNKTENVIKVSEKDEFGAKADDKFSDSQVSDLKSSAQKLDSVVKDVAIKDISTLNPSEQKISDFSGTENMSTTSKEKSPRRESLSLDIKSKMVEESLATKHFYGNTGIPSSTDSTFHGLSNIEMGNKLAGHGKSTTVETSNTPAILPVGALKSSHSQHEPKSSKSEEHHIEKSSASSIASQQTSLAGGAPPSGMPHLPLPPNDKNNPHLIPIPSLPNPMMSSGMPMPAGMNLFPPHMMNPYFPMFDPRMAAAFQQQMFQRMPPLHPRFQQGQPQRAPRSRGPRGPRQSKSQQQSAHPPEVIRHHGRPPPLQDPPQLKIDPLPESMSSSLTSGMGKEQGGEPQHSSSSRSSTPRSQTSLTSPVTTPDNLLHVDGLPSSVISSLHQQQPPPAHSHGKIHIPPLPPGMMPPAHAYGKSDLPPGMLPMAAHSHAKIDMPHHPLGAAPPAHSHGHGPGSHTPGVSKIQESLPPPAHSMQATTTVKTTSLPVTSVAPTSKKEGTAVNANDTSTSLTTSAHTTESITPSIESGVSTVTPVSATPSTVSTTSTSSSTTSTSSGDNNDVMSSHHETMTTSTVVVTASQPLPAHAHPISQSIPLISGSEPLPAHVHPTSTTTVTSHVETSSVATTGPSTSTVLHSEISAPNETSTITVKQEPSVLTAACSMSAVSSVPVHSHSGPYVSLPGPVGSQPQGIPQNIGAPLSMPGNFPPMGPMHPGMAQPFMQPKVRGQRMSGSKQRGGAPEMPHGMPMMPPFGRFPQGMSMNPFFARMAMSPDMMALAQRMATSGPSVSEGDPGSGQQIPKLDPSQLEMLKNMNMRMRPPMGMRPGMAPRGMPPPPRYPGMSGPVPEGMPHRLPGMPPAPISAGQGTMPLTSPTSSIKSASESQSPHPAASPVAPSASPHSSLTGAGDKTPSPVPRSPANSDTTSVGSTPVKQEPLEQRIRACKSMFLHVILHSIS